MRGALLVVLCGALAGCRTSTQITIDVSTDVACSSWQGAAITVGELGLALEALPPTTTSTYCNDAGHVGTLVAIPSGADNAKVAFRVVGAVTASLDACTLDAGAGCIVARRALNFIPHEALGVSVPLRAACEGVVCDPNSTCVEGACWSATIPDPSGCASATCGEGDLSPPDGGAPDWGRTSPGDGGTEGGAIADATLSDAETDAGGDAGGGGEEAGPILDGAALGCGTSCGLAVGADLACALHSGGVQCWGANYLGQLGNGSEATTVGTTAVVAAGGGALGGIQGIVSGEDTACAFLASGTVSCWGGAAPLAVTGNASWSSATPQSLLTGAGSIAIANYHLCWQHGATTSCATTSGPGEAAAFGDLADAGEDSGIVATVPPPAGSTGPLLQLDSSAYFTCVLDATKTAYCLGDNDSNECDPTGASPGGVLTSYVRVVLPNHLPVDELGLMQQAACARQNGAVSCWGSDYMNAIGGLPDGGEATVNPIVYADGGPVTDAVHLAPGDLHTCALLASAQVACWGDNGDHQLGRGEPVAQAGGTSTVAQVVRLADGGAFGGITSVASGGNHTCATTGDGTVWCWGQNEYGQTAPTDSTDRSSPTPLSL